MPREHPHALALSRKVLRTLIGLNFVAGGLIFVLLVMSFTIKNWLMTGLDARAAMNDASLVLAMRSIMLIGLAAVPLTHVVLSRLLAIVETVRAGDPFVAENAARLYRIAWSILGLELMHVA